MSLRSAERKHLITHIPGGGAPLGPRGEVVRHHVNNMMNAARDAKPAIDSARREASRATDSFVSSVRNSANNAIHSVVNSVPRPSIPGDHGGWMP